MASSWLCSAKYRAIRALLAGLVVKTPAGGDAGGVGEDDDQRPANLSDKGTPAARSWLVIPFSLRGLGEKELADSRLLGNHHGALVHATVLLEKVS